MSEAYWEHHLEVWTGDFYLAAHLAKQQAQAMWRNDSEINDITLIEHQVKKWALSSDEAKKKISGILNAKQDYN